MGFEDFLRVITADPWGKRQPVHIMPQEPNGIILNSDFSLNLHLLSSREMLSGQTCLRSTCGPRYNNFQKFKEHSKVAV